MDFDENQATWLLFDANSAEYLESATKVEIIIILIIRVESILDAVFEEPMIFDLIGF